VSSSSVQAVEVSYFLQMTEDEERVRKAVEAVLGGERAAEREEAEGHFGNKIVWMRHHITGGEAEEACKAILSKLDPSERRTILEDLSSWVDDHGALYVRLNKQALVMEGRCTLASSDPVRVKVKPRSFAMKGDPGSFYSRLFEEAEEDG
jgi:RNA binding exosome subunit